MAFKDFRTYRWELLWNFVESEKGEECIKGLGVGSSKEYVGWVDRKEEGGLVRQVLVLEHFSGKVVQGLSGEDEEGVAEEDCRELEACDKADDGVVLLQPVEADCKSANEEGVEGEERQVGLKRVAVVGNVQKVSTVPPEVSYQVI